MARLALVSVFMTEEVVQTGYRGGLKYSLAACDEIEGNCRSSRSFYSISTSY